MHIDRQDAIFNSAAKVDAETYRVHVAGFIDNFVVKSRRARWKYLLLERLSPSRCDLTRLSIDLDGEYCTLVKKIYDLYDLSGTGVYYDGYHDPVWLAGETALDLGIPSTVDAIFSLQPGEFAVYFSHDLERMWCRRKKGIRHS